MYPGERAKAFVDFRETIRNLDPAQRNAVVGATNYRLIESGVVQWSDVVTANRIRGLAEVVALKRLSVKQLTSIGIPRSRAEAAVAAANDPRNDPAGEARRRLLAALERRGIDAATARRAAADRLAARVSSRPPEAPPAPPAAPAVTPSPAPAPVLPTIAALPPAPPLAPAARVRLASPDRPKYEEAWRGVLGRVPDDAEAAALAGAPDGAEVTARGRDGGYVTVSWQIPGVAEASRAFYRDDAGKLVLHAAYFEVTAKERGKGLGRESFGRMVEAAQAAGFDRIFTHAARGSTMVGYRVWPRFGYDGEIPEAIRRVLPPDLAGARNVSDLMATEAGRTWWDQNGQGVNLRFSLARNSRSLKVWEAYRAAKAATSPTSRRRTRP